MLLDHDDDMLFLGTLLRICAAAGCQSFITSTGCVDVWEPKVLRCAAGGHFYVPIHYNLHWEDIETLVKDKRIFLADNNIPGMKINQHILFYMVQLRLSNTMVSASGFSGKRQNF